MSKQVKKSAIELKTEEMYFGVDEAVSILMAKYDDNVNTKLKSKQEKVDEADSDYQSEIDRVKQSVNTDQYNHTSDILGIRSRVAGVSVDLGETVEDSKIQIVLKLTDLDINSSNYQPEIGKYRNLELSKSDYDALINKRDRKSKAIEKLNKIRNLNRCEVEVQVRAKVMSKQLEKMGLDYLIEDSEVLELIKV